MTLEEAIKHAEEVAKENEDSAKEYYRIANLECHPNKKDAENSYIKCTECYKEHRQLAEWLRELKAYKESDWIPCSEPPKKEGTYIVYAPGYMGGSSSAKENYNGVMFSKYKNGKWSIEHGYYKRPNCVKAWKPLPEPYRGEQDENR